MRHGNKSHRGIPAVAAGRQQVNVRYLASISKSAVTAPSLTSTSLVTLPLRWVASTVCLPGGTRLIVKPPSLPLTARRRKILHANVGEHPGLHGVLEAEKLLCRGEGKLEVRAASQLRLIGFLFLIAALLRGRWVDIVQERVGILHLQGLPSLECHHIRHLLTTLLIQQRGLGTRARGLAGDALSVANTSTSFPAEPPC